MLIKEYRIPMPLSVEEYRIAQLYMIQKKSRDESQGTESGVEILENEPYTDGPGGNGQYTHKIYHISKHIPGWLVSLLPKDALIVVEQAWNAYPYTRTRYTCPFVEKFSIDIETRYFNDVGESDNAFDLSSSELRSRIIDEIDIVKEQVSDYKKEEDPKLFKSKKTGRGPLSEDWLASTKTTKADARGNVMCAYKRCKVEFKYWGMQSKIEKFIHDTGLRKVMLRAHKQAWCWQDEWFGLTMEDIRRLEKETQLALRLKFESVDESLSDSDITLKDEDSDLLYRKSSNNQRLIPGTNEPNVKTRNESTSSSLTARQNGALKSLLVRQTSGSSILSNKSKFSNPDRRSSQMNFSDGRIEGIRRYSTDISSDEDEFFDAQDELPQNDQSDLQSLSTYRWSSIENLENAPSLETDGADKKYVENQTSVEADSYEQTGLYTPAVCKISVLFLILHGGNSLELSHQGIQSSKQSDFNTLQTTFENVVNTHYKSAGGRLAMRLVACPPICNDAFKLLQNLSPFGHDNSISHEQTLSSALVSLFATCASQYSDMISTLIMSCNLVYNAFLESSQGKGFCGKVCIISDTVGSVMAYDMLCNCPPRRRASSAFSSRRGSSLSNHEEEDDETVASVPSSPSLKVSPPQRWELNSAPFSQTGRRCSATPSLGSVQGSDNSFLSVSLGHNSAQMLSPQRRSSTNCCPDIQRSSSYSGPNNCNQLPSGHSPQMQNTSFDSVYKLDFEVAEFFMLGSPLGLILAMRQVRTGNDTIMSSQRSMPQATPPTPACHHIYNLFYTADPSSARIEPLLDMRFCNFPPSTIVKYQMFPLGDGQSISIGDLLATSNEAFSETPTRSRRPSEWSIGSGVLDQQTTGSLHQIATRWWGEKRIDYALFYPEALSDFPSSALPHLFHSSFWESYDVVAFVLRQVVKHDLVQVRLNDGKEEAYFTPAIPREKWLRKRTHVKLRNVTANHRAKDCIALENQPQVLSGRFMYGPLDMVTLTGEKVDVHVMTQPPGSEWLHISTETTSGHGKITCTIPDNKRLGLGIYPVKMVVRGDHTSADSYLAVLPPHTDSVIFSIDGSFTASMSIMGSDPKVRPGAVDVVRLWQDLGYVIIYVTARPNLQKHRVVTWLAQHNFPHGLVWFGDGLSHDPLKQKTILLRNMKNDYKLNYAAGYGSSKDIAVYSQLGLEPEQIYIVGKTSKKQAQQCHVLSDGYSVHLSEMVTDGVKAAKFNAQVILRKGCFGLPGQIGTRKSRPSVTKKSRTSFKPQGSYN